MYKEQKEVALAVSKACGQLTTAFLGALDSADLGSLFDIDAGHADVTPAGIIEFTERLPTRISTTQRHIRWSSSTQVSGLSLTG